MDRLADQIRGELARFGPQAGLAEVVAAWPDAVGAAIARNAWPARIARDGTLHVSTTDSVWAFELGHRGAEIAARLEVPRIRFAPGPLAREEPKRDAPALPPPTREQEQRAFAVAAPIADEKLRESVQKAVLSSLVRGPRGGSL